MRYVTRYCRGPCVTSGALVTLSEEEVIRHSHAPFSFGPSMLALLFLAVAWPVRPAAGQTSQSPVLPTDSLTGTLQSSSPDAFVVTSADRGPILFEIAPDTLDTRTQMVADSVARPVPHPSIMDRRDVLFIVGQLEESDERDRVHVHYATVGETEPRRIAAWLSVERSRLPGG